MRAAWLAIPAGLAAAWAFWPMRSPGLSSTDAVRSSEVGHDAGATSLDLGAFRSPLWITPPPPPPPPAPPPVPPPVRLQLLAVIHEEGVYKAVLYDPDADRVVVVAQGETLGTRTVERVTEAGVQIRDGSGLRTLALRQPQPGGGP